MRVTKALILGTLAALLVGTLLSGIVASAQREIDPSVITVPVGRVGDEVLYAQFVGDDKPTSTLCETSGETRSCRTVSCEVAAEAPEAYVSTDDCEPIDPKKPTGLHAYAVDRVTNTLDRAGALHQAVVTRYNETWLQGGWSGLPWTEESYVDLATRTGFRTDRKFNSTWASGANLTISEFTEEFDGRDILWYQGRSFALGDDVPLPRPIEGGSHSFYRDDARFIRDLLDRQTRLIPRIDVKFVEESVGAEEAMFLEAMRVTSRVEDRRIINGHDAYEIRISIRIDGSLIAASIPADPDDPELAALRYAILFVEISTWVSADLPYPVLFEMREGMDVAGVRRVEQHDLYSLAEYRVGSSPIPWTTKAPGPAPLADRTPPSQLYPADGGSQLAYKLSTAVADAASPATPLAFQLWRQQHPGSLLVSAELRRGEASSRDSGVETALWHLVYATPSGAGYELTLERGPASPAPVFNGRERSVRPFKVSELPQSPVTLGHAERAWASSADGAYTRRAPNFVHWGYDLDLRPSCWEQATGVAGLEPADFRLLRVGYTSEGSCVDSVFAQDESALIVDTQSGSLQGLYEYRKNIDLKALLDTQGLLPIEPQSAAAKTVPAGLRPPTVEGAAVASSGALAVFLALYFLPVLKFLGAKAMFAFPSYAKLRKEELLDNRIRDQILQVVRNDPGINTTDLARRVDAGWGTVVYHLSVLERNNLVSSLVDGRFHRFFPVGVIDFSARGQVAVMKNERTKQIYELIDVEPGIVQEALARRVGISPPAAIFHLKRLEEVGMVGRVKKGRKVHYYTNEKRMLPATDTPPLQGMEFQ